MICMYCCYLLSCKIRLCRSICRQNSNVIIRTQFEPFISTRYHPLSPLNVLCYTQRRLSVALPNILCFIIPALRYLKGRAPEDRAGHAPEAGLLWLIFIGPLSGHTFGISPRSIEDEDKYLASSSPCSKSSLLEYDSIQTRHGARTDFERLRDRLVDNSKQHRGCKVSSEGTCSAHVDSLSHAMAPSGCEISSWNVC